MNEETEKELIGTVLSLVAEAKALKVMIGFLLSDNPNAFSRLKTFAADVDGMTLHMPMTETQREEMRESLLHTVQTVEADPYRWKLGTPPSAE